MHALSRSLPGFCKLLRSKRKIRASFVVNHLVLQPPRTATLPGVERHSLDINCGRGILTTVRRCRRGTSIRLPFAINRLIIAHGGDLLIVGSTKLDDSLCIKYTNEIRKLEQARKASSLRTDYFPCLKAKAAPPNP
ncbi:hypothetical protein ECG_00331 [Echinococcus granulosus]|nr:hypothetical protein ECG_00331 [Echinococcus granulosus]